jgi:hypothetical protein
MSRQRVKANPYLESMLNGALLAHMQMPGENFGRPQFLPGSFPVVPDRRLDSFRQERIEWETPYLEEAYISREEEIDDMAP